VTDEVLHQCKVYSALSSKANEVSDLILNPDVKMLNKKSQSHKRKKLRIRKKVEGTAERPRMAIHKSNRYVYVQFVDDLNGRVLLSVSSSSLKLKHSANIKAAASLGAAAGEKALASGIKQVVFDRGGYIYHGKVRAFADSCRKAGLKF